MNDLTWVQNKGSTASQTITGQSPIPAIACAIVFALFGVASIVNWVATRSPNEEMTQMPQHASDNNVRNLHVSVAKPVSVDTDTNNLCSEGTNVRAIAYACKASALYEPNARLEGVFMTFINSGLGATVAVICISLGNWFRFKEAQYFSVRTENFIKWLSFLLCIPLIIAGIGFGVAASVLVYSGFGVATVGVGFGIRMAGSVSLCVINGIINIMLMVVTVRVFRHVPEPDDRYHKAHIFEWKRRNTKMVILLLGGGLLLQVRSITGVCALWYSTLWNNDITFYLLDGFPEMIALTMLSVPTLLARCAQYWPPRMRETAERSSKSEEP